jgi:hypothetical protein
MYGDIRGCLVSVAAPVFLADMDHQTGRLRLHVRRGVELKDVRARAQAALDVAGFPVEVVVRAYDLRHLAFPRSLEHWLDRFQLGDVIHDPTMIVGRGQALLRAARACRQSLGRTVKGVFFDPARRALVVVVRGGAGEGEPVLREDIRRLVDAAWSPPADADATAGVVAPPRVSVQVATSLPRGDLVPVDNRSASLTRRLASDVRRWLAPLTLALAAAAIAAPASAKTDGRAPTFAPDARAASVATTHQAEFGVLTGLSVFADGPRRLEVDAFASRGLQMFFGAATPRGPGVQVAQGTVRRANLADVDSGISGQPGS